MATKERTGIARTPSGVAGLDEITHGGLPLGRSTLVLGGPGCGKSMFGLQFLAKGASELGEPGVLVTFEESLEDILENAASVELGIEDLVAEKKLAIAHIEVERAELEAVGAYSLEGLFARLALAIDDVGAKRVAIDTLEVLFSALDNETIVRAELRRLFRWLKVKGVTAVITAERGNSGYLSRHGLEEYVSDCVIALDHRVSEQVATRVLRIVKYRGSEHGTGEYPFLIDEDGLTVVPITSLGLEHPASTEKLSTGVPSLDDMLGGGYYKGTTILMSGGAGTGKSTLAAAFVKAAADRGDRAIYFAFEESPHQIVRNMSSVGIDLQGCLGQGLLEIISARPSLYGLEHHLAKVHKTVEKIDPKVVVLDPITNFEFVASGRDAKAMLTRLVDLFKSRGITAVFTSLTAQEQDSMVGISSIVDTWLQIRNYESAGERNRTLYVLKSRGMAHSNQIREFMMGDDGVKLVDVYMGPAGVLLGSDRKEQERRDALEDHDVEELDRRRDAARARQETSDG